MHKKWVAAKKGAEKKKLSLSALPRKDLGKKLDKVEDSLSKFEKNLKAAKTALTGLEKSYGDAIGTLNDYITASVKDKALNAELGTTFIEIARLLKGQVQGVETPSKTLATDVKTMTEKFK